MHIVEATRYHDNRLNKSGRWRNRKPKPNQHEDHEGLHGKLNTNFSEIAQSPRSDPRSRCARQSIYPRYPVEAPLGRVFFCL